MIYLLDLNYTLASSVAMNFKTFVYNVKADVYRKDLAEALANERIFLVTARTDNYKDETIAKIKKDLALNIERYYFKPFVRRMVKVHDFKKEVALSLFAEGFKAEDFFGIESNAVTRAAYKSIGIDSCTYANFMQKKTSPTLTLF